jgi:hypothetical protein
MDFAQFFLFHSLSLATHILIVVHLLLVLLVAVLDVLEDITVIVVVNKGKVNNILACQSHLICYYAWIHC